MLKLKKLLMLGLAVVIAGLLSSSCVTDEGKAYVKFTWNTSLTGFIFMGFTPDHLENFYNLTSMDGDGNPSIPDKPHHGEYYKTGLGTWSVAYRYDFGLAGAVDVIIDYRIRMNNQYDDIYFEIAMDPMGQLSGNVGAVENQDGHTVGAIRHENYRRTSNLLNKSTGEELPVYTKTEKIERNGNSVELTYRAIFHEPAAN